MKLKSNFIAILLFHFMCATAVGFDPGALGVAARQGFEQILDLWRLEDYEGLYARLEHPPGHGWEYFAQRIVYASRVPACCWEKLQDVKVTVIDQDEVTINAKVGFEVEGVGTRFVTRDFHLRHIAGIWKLPMQDILDLSQYNLQRIPREIYEREP
ncbi:MAG: hypothetical protein FD174_3934 [Geobacteraceae bacterium]|nr:MAG: hypothetical protein FD174_3934 [Geobacteraceae bacterium]